MLGENESKSLALFFFFACLDDARAREAASKAADELERLVRGKTNMDSVTGVVWVSQRIWNQISQKITRGRPQYSTDSGWQIPTNIDMGHWKEFQKTAPEDELLAVIWVHILGFPEEQVSRALGLTPGTLRYRVGRGLRKLGSILSGAGRPLKVVRSR